MNSYFTRRCFTTAFTGVLYKCFSAVKLFTKHPLEVVIELIEDFMEGKVEFRPFDVAVAVMPAVLGILFHFFVWDVIVDFFSQWTPKFKGVLSDIRRNLLMIGNPGRGKSTLLNGIAGEAKFNSGMNVGSGMTTTKQDELVRGLHLVDSPGLADISKRKEKAQEIQAALMSEGAFKIFFVINLNSGRLAPEDVATMQLVLEAANQIPENGYAVIINKASKTLSNEFRKDKEGFLRKLALSQTLPKPTQHVIVAERVSHLEDASNKIWRLPRELRDFIDEVPIIHIDSRKVKELHDERFEELKQYYDKKIGEIQKELSDLKEKQSQGLLRRVAWTPLRRLRAYFYAGTSCALDPCARRDYVALALDT